QACQHQPGELGLEVSTAVVELAVPEPHSGRDRLVPAVDGDPVTSLELVPCRGVLDEPPLRSTDVFGKLVRSGTSLLAGDHVGGGGSQPLHESLSCRRTQTVDVDSGYPQHVGETSRSPGVARKSLLSGRQGISTNVPPTPAVPDRQAGFVPAGVESMRSCIRRTTSRATRKTGP